MVECKLVSIEEIKKDNPRLCLSPLRAFGKCHECDRYMSKAGIPCDSRIVSKEGEQRLVEIQTLKQEISDKKEELQRLRGRL